VPLGPLCGRLAAVAAAAAYISIYAAPAIIGLGSRRETHYRGRETHATWRFLAKDLKCTLANVL
jgi:hypothetical protein